MPASRAIAHYILRTTDAPAAREFYADLLGQDRMPIVPLHEQALARGARPHWLGQIEVDDVEQTTNAFVALGAEALGPIATFPDGRRFAVFRDPGGAIIGVTTPGAHDDPQVVVWHQLDTNDRARAVRAYTSLFGWRLTRRVTHPEHADVEHFAWADATADAGWIVDVQERVGHHPHWLFYLRVSDLDRALATVRAANGVVLGPFTLPNGERIAACDDPQGAAFGLRS